VDNNYNLVSSLVSRINYFLYYGRTTTYSVGNRGYLNYSALTARSQNYIISDKKQKAWRSILGALAGFLFNYCVFAIGSGFGEVPIRHTLGHGS